MRKIMVTGINGFVGKHLVNTLASRGHTVIGVGREDLDPTISKLVTRYYRIDLTSPAEVAKLELEGIGCVINLAGLAAVGPSYDQPDLYKQINVGVLTHLGNRLIEKAIPARMIAISTGTVYDPHQDMPLTEESKLNNQASPYALSKLAMEEEADRLRKVGLNCIVVRPFNHIGPGQTGGFLVPDLLTQIRGAKASHKAIETGDLSTRRDYTDVRDVVRAYADLAESDLNHNLYNICSGKSVAGTKILDCLMKIEGAGDLEVKVDPAKLRPSDIKELYGSFERLHADTGWQPEIALDQTLADFSKAS